MFQERVLLKEVLKALIKITTQPYICRGFSISPGLSYTLSPLVLPSTTVGVWQNKQYSNLVVEGIDPYHLACSFWSRKTDTLWDLLSIKKMETKSTPLNHVSIEGYENSFMKVLCMSIKNKAENSFIIFSVIIIAIYGDDILK